MAAINPYLNFNGNCEEAFAHYKNIFGGDFVTVMRFKDAPSEMTKSDASEDNKIMHMALPIGKGTILMGSDRPLAFGPGSNGDNFSVAIGTESEDEATRIYNGLSDGGNITMPLAKTFWGAFFGMFTDKYGVQWMVSYDENQKPQ